MQAILDFFTGPLNTVAWVYILLPCVAIGGIFFTFATIFGNQFAALFVAIALFLFALSGVVAKLTKEHFAKDTHRLR